VPKREVNVRTRGTSGHMITPTKHAAQCFTETWKVLRSPTILDIPENSAAYISSMGLNCFIITIEHGARNSSKRRSIGADLRSFVRRGGRRDCWPLLAASVPLLLTQAVI
jgi:hypothetical protein